MPTPISAMPAICCPLSRSPSSMIPSRIAVIGLMNVTSTTLVAPAVARMRKKIVYASAPVSSAHGNPPAASL